MRPGSVCRHLKIAGRVPISRFFHVTSQQPRKVAPHPTTDTFGHSNRCAHHSGWITEHGNKIYGHFWRYVIDPVTKRRKRTHASVPLGYIGKLKKWEAKEKLKFLVAEDLGPQQVTEP